MSRHTTAARLRRIIARYGAAGTLAVGGYLLAHYMCHKRSKRPVAIAAIAAGIVLTALLWRFPADMGLRFERSNGRTDNVDSPLRRRAYAKTRPTQADSGPSPQELLFAATCAGDVHAAERALNLGADIDANGEPPETVPFYVAATRRDSRMMRFLLHRGADVDGGGECFDIAGALAFAARENDFKLARFLLANGADVNNAERFGTALTQAATAGHPGMMRLLLDHGASPTYGDYHNDLIILVVDRPAVRALLLHRGANPNACEWLGRTLLGRVAADGDVSTMKALVAAGARIDGRGAHDDTPLIDAAGEGRRDSVEYLLRHGAAVNAIASGSEYDQRYEGTALDAAIRAHHESVVRLLVRHGARTAMAIHTHATTLRQ